MDFLKLIQEGRVDDFKAKYSQKFGKDNVYKIVGSVPQKYLEWVGKNLDMVNFEENLSKLSNALSKFEKISTNLPITDLFQYKNLGQLLGVLSDYENRQRRTVKKVDGGNVVYDDGRFFVVNPLTHDSSCYYGKGTKWCTTTDSDNHFKRYNEDGKLFYILDRNAPSDDKFYKVALLQKFDGDKTYYDALDATVKSGWIFNTNKLNEILSSVNEYLNLEYPEQIKIYKDKELAKKEKARLESIRIQQILNQRLADAQERRLDGEWTLDDDCPDVGLKAHALLNFLVDAGDVEEMTNQDRNEIARIQSEIDRLQTEYDNDEDVRGDLLDEISNLEDELTELENKIDVYYIVPTGSFYDTTEFEVIGVSDLEDRIYAVGDEDEMESSSYESVDQLLDDIGFEGYPASFVENYIDEDAVKDYAEEFYRHDVSDSPESYFDDSQRDLSDDQTEKISILQDKIEKFNNLVSQYEDSMSGEDDDDELLERVDELNELIEEMETEIEDINEDPEGDFPDDLIEDAIYDRVKDATNDIVWFMDEWGLEKNNYINRREFIKAVYEEDGYCTTLNGYDGNAEDIYVNKNLFYVMRID